MKSLIALLALLAFVVSLPAVTGCATFNDRVDDIRLQRLATSRYRAEYSHLPKGKSARHFERGWKQGFYDARVGKEKSSVAFGSTSAYYSTRYDTQIGQNARQLWTTGYEVGYHAVPVVTEAFIVEQH